MRWFFFQRFARDALTECSNEAGTKRGYGVTLVTCDDGSRGTTSSDHVITKNDGHRRIIRVVIESCGGGP